MFAVIKTGGKQYSVTAGDDITVMTLAGEPGDDVTFDNVLMLAGDGEPSVGAPFIEGAKVSAEIVGQKRGPKVIAFKKRRRQNSKRKRGHRQDLTLVRITGVGGVAHQSRPDRARDRAEALSRQGGTAFALHAEAIAAQPGPCNQQDPTNIKINRRCATGAPSRKDFGARRWRIRRQAARPATAATPKAGASASRSSAAKP